MAWQWSDGLRESKIQCHSPAPNIKINKGMLSISHAKCPSCKEATVRLFILQSTFDYEMMFCYVNKNLPTLKLCI